MSVQHIKSISNVKSNVTVVVITAATAVVMFSSLVLAAPASATEQRGNSSVAATSSQGGETKAAKDLRVTLTTLLQEHVTTNLAVNRAIASGATQAEINVAIEAQVANADSLSAAVGSIYGPAAAAQFSELFLEHIDESNNFALAVAAGDENAKALANEELQEYLVDIANFFSSAIPVLPADAVHSLLLEHETLMNQSTEALINKNFGQSKKIEQQALRQITVVAEALAAGIVETQPQLFQ
jgi:hypothetical protein